MSAYTAIDAISPAIQRTRDFMFRPFKLGRFLKLALVATLTEGAFASVSSPGFPGSPGGKIPEFPAPHLSLPSMFMVLCVVAAVLLVVVPILIFVSYLLLRLRFAFFDCVLFEQDQIGPAWGRYHEQALRYLWLSLGIAVGFWVVMVLGAGAALWKYRALLQSLFHGGTKQWADFLPLFGIALLLFFFVALFGLVVDSTLNYFVLPHMALEDATAWQAIHDVWSEMKAEPLQFALFLIMRLILPLVAGVIGAIAVFIPILLVAGILVVIGFALHAVSQAVMIGYIIVAGAAFLALLVCAMIGVGGTIGTFMRNYALLFYGGRYPELARVLWPLPSLPSAPMMPGAGYPTGSF
ncbi:DUF7544 domain-containing protein [Acidicapsa ligni]|uniref:DUF7544 domain-containing protein n=1 Tax=Acidicapsa ligni TaxID=542300 RepID=UPI0021DF897D|nr:hypothetical protein [Acidicapsa ligni]